MPRVARAGRQHPAGAGGRRDAHHGAEVAEMRRIFQEHDRRAFRAAEHRRRIDLGPHRDRQNPGFRRHWRQPGEGRRCYLLNRRLQPRAQIGRQIARQADQRIAAGGAGDLDPGIEAHRMLERMKTFENDQRRIGARPGEALDRGLGKIHRRGRPQVALSSSRTIDSPITEVDTLAMPGCMMSAVRRPPASTRPIASSS
jgi:hypothetical protein